MKERVKGYWRRDRDCNKNGSTKGLKDSTTNVKDETREKSTD